MPLDRVLKDFANAYGVELSLEGVSGVVDAKFRTNNAQDFLDRLALEYHFQWFVYSDKLYVSPQTDQASRRLEISADATPDLKQALTDIGLLDKRFGWGELLDEGAVLVRGPARYVELIRNFTKKQSNSEEQQLQVMIFPLRYASVADREINYRGQRMNIPGVATILEGILDEQSRTSQPQDPKDDIVKLQDMADRGRANIFNLVNEKVAKPSEVKSKKLSERRRIVADVRSNSVLIYDNLNERAAYQRLIEQMDQRSELVQIDAIILDIDRSELSSLESRWSAQAGSAGFGSSLLTSGSSTLFIRDFGRFFADINALEGKGMATVIARPSVLTLENQPAVIDFSRTQYITATGERVANIEAVTAGTSLRVTPRKIRGGPPNSFHLIVDIEDGQLESIERQEAPTVRRGTVSTQAMIGESRSLVIGGFHVDQSGDQKSQIPLLGGIPLIGSLFSSTKRDISRRERLFILTPRLIGGEVESAYSANKESSIRFGANIASDRSLNKGAALRTRIISVFSALISNKPPSSVSRLVSGPALIELCASNKSLVFEGERIKWFKAPDFTVAAGIIKNVTSTMQRFDPVSCSGPKTLAVAVDSDFSVRPGESTKILVAFKSSVVSQGPVSSKRILMLPSR